MSKQKLKRKTYQQKQRWCKLLNILRRFNQNPNIWTAITYRSYTSSLVYYGKEIRRNL